MTTPRSCKKIYSVLFLSALCIAALLFHAGYTDAVETLGTVGNAYDSLLFDTSLVHTIDIEMDDWQRFLDTCTDEKYVECNLTIDGEPYKKAAVRAKGNTSLSQVESYGNDRYSFKIEFNHYNQTSRYHGLDKLCLNNIIQDNAYVKAYLTYQMMRYFGAAAPLCSFVYITVGGEDWGLYLAVEGVEDTFLARNYGGNYLEETVDIDCVIRYFVVHNFVCNFDSYTGSMIHNYYLYEQNGRLSMIPWDYNLAYGSFEGSADADALVNYSIDTPVSGGDTNSRPMLAWIFSQEEYTTLVDASTINISDMGTMHPKSMAPPAG